MNTQYPAPRIAGRLAREAGPARADDGDAVDLLALLGAIWRRKWVVIGAAALLAGLVALAVSQITPRYSAVAKVMMDPRELRVVTSEEVVSNLDLSNPVIESEVAVIRSSVLLEAVIDAIGLDRMREFNPALRPEGGWRDAADALAARVAERLGGGMGAPPGAAAPQEPSAGAARRGGGGGDRESRRVVGGLRPFLDVYQEGKSYVIAIQASAEDPVLAADIVNTVASQYIAAQLAERVEGTRRATAWLETRVADLRDQVAASERAVEAYRAEKLAADGGGIETATQQLAAMSAQLAVARADRAAAQARHDQIRGLVEAEGAPAAAEVLTSPLVVALREARSALLREEAELATRYGEAHPLRASLRAEVGRLDADLADEMGKIIEGLRTEVDVARIREDSMAADLLALEERMSSISGSSIDLRHLEREAVALRGVYESFLSRLKETRAQAALAQAEAKVIEEAQPAGAPSHPRTKLLVGASGVVGAALGLGLVLLLELGSRSFRSVQQVERETGLPVLASLPRGARRRTAAQALRALVAKPHSEYGERVRQLRTALMFGGNEAPRSVIVASSLPGEGRTATTLALAHMNVLMGRSVIVVDCDFRRAALAAAFGWTPEKDLASLLRGEATPEEAIVRDRSLGFDVLPTARPVANLGDTLTPARFRALIEALGASYDIVLVDAPPVLATAEARVIGSSADALIYLVRWRSTSATAVRQGLALLGELGVEPTGLVLSMVDSRREPGARRAARGYAA